MSLPHLTTFSFANGSTGFVLALPSTTEVSISFNSRSQQQQQTVGSLAPPRSRSSSCPPRLPRAQAWSVLPLKPLSLARFAPMHKAPCPHLEETAGCLAGPIRSTSGGMPTLNIFPYHSFGGVGGRLCLCYRLVCICFRSQDREHTVHSCRSEYPRRWACRD